MPKGKTNQPLTILVTPEMMNNLVVSSLMEQGHTISSLPPECVRADLLLGVNCHILTEQMLTKPGIMLAAMKEARKRKKANKNAKQAGN